MTRSYVANLRKRRIENPGLSKLEAISKAMGFPPTLYFEGNEGETPDDALQAGPRDGAVREILEEAQRLGPRDRRLLLKIARQQCRPKYPRRQE